MRCSRIGTLVLLMAVLECVCVCFGKTCLLVYQVADNNLEFYLRKDFEEITLSPAVHGDDLRTWVYHDARNEGRGEPLPNTVDANGSAVTGTFFGSRYMTYDKDLQKMRIVVQLPGEVNSDIPATIQSFLEYGIQDCLKNNYTSLMAAFSSHAGGFAGFGGDKATRRNLRELLKINLQTNQAIAVAIRAALDTTVGTDQKLEVLAFDACLMQSVGSADDYRTVAKYILASEAVEPGHGWAYDALTNASSALDLSKNVLITFTEGTHGRRFHQTPKTLSILDTDKFDVFIVGWESLFMEILDKLHAGDISLYSFLSRARASSVVYEGLVDTVGTTNPSALDVGSFLTELQLQCNPTAQLGLDLKATREAYADMIIAEGIGPGTSPGTGMHITWPHKAEYADNPDLWNQILFESPDFVTHILPNFGTFLQWYLSSSLPSNRSQQAPSLCSKSVVSTTIADDPNALILNATAFENTTTGDFTINAEISSNVTQMWVEYGIDLSTPLRPFLRDKGYTPRDDEFLFLLGGDVVGKYNGSSFNAAWDQNFYFLNVTSTNSSNSSFPSDGFEALYVYDEGDGSKKVPVMYFADAQREELANLGLLDYLFFDQGFWERNGARFSFLQFSVDEADGRINDNLNLFISDEVNGFAEQPRELGGLIVPLICVNAFIQGQSISILPGGFNQTIIEWRSTLSYNIIATEADRVFNIVPSTDAVIVNLYAFNHGEPDAEPDKRTYDVIRRIYGLTDDYIETEAPSFMSGGVSYVARIRQGLGMTALLVLAFLL